MMEQWYDQSDPEIIATVSELFQLLNGFQREQIDRFKSEVRNARVIESIDADHSIFYSNQEEVYQAIRLSVEGIE